MTIESELLQALRDLDAAVHSLRTRTAKPDLVSLFERIDRLADRIPPGHPGELAHYLQKKSYEKARLWLEGREAENAKGAHRH